MIFIMGINQGIKKLDFSQAVLCAACGRYGGYEVFMAYTYLSLFFIPILKWGRHYYVKTTCCGSECELDKETGEKIRKGEQVMLSGLSFAVSSVRKCNYCGFITEKDFKFCPSCGRELS